MPKELKGDGPPDGELKVAIGQKYREHQTEKAWVMTRDGWQKLTVVHVEPLWSEKRRWMNAATASGMNLEEWACRTLNGAAEASNFIDYGKDKPVPYVAHFVRHLQKGTQEFATYVEAASFLCDGAYEGRFVAKQIAKGGEVLWDDSDPANHLPPETIDPSVEVGSDVPADPDAEAK